MRERGNNNRNIMFNLCELFSLFFLFFFVLFCVLDNFYFNTFFMIQWFTTHLSIGLVVVHVGGFEIHCPILKRCPKIVTRYWLYIHDSSYIWCDGFLPKKRVQILIVSCRQYFIGKVLHL